MASYANPSHPYVITGETNESKRESSSGKSESKSFTITPGYYLRDNLLLSASLTKSETEYAGGTYDNNTALLTTKWLHVLPSGKTYNFVAGVARSNYDSTSSSSSHVTAVYLSSEYYLTPAFSLGALVAVGDSSDSDSNTKTYGLSSSWYITPSLFAKLSGIKYNGNSTDSENVSLALGMRF